MLLKIILLSLLTGTAAYQTFESWKKDKTYASKQEERLRKAIYETNLEKIVMHNLSGGSHKLGINQFMDLKDHELPRGYDKSLHRESTTATSTATDTAITEQERHLAESDLFESLNINIQPVEALPDSVDWRSAATPVKDQGRCGSCWAFSSIAALESHLYLNEGLLFSLSVQQTVSCAPNVKHCGGEGGCKGATSVQAYEYLMKAGIVQEWTYGNSYDSFHGGQVECRLTPAPHHETLVSGAIATIDGFITLPLNNYTIMMNAVAKLGPIVISVAAQGWGLYAGGVFHHDFSNSQDADINHAVVLMGYGTDEQTGEGYWLVRNSWGPRWGEAGYIRLYREDPAVSPDHDQCAMDVTPGDGDACKIDDNGNPIDPLPDQKICGTSGAYTNGYIPVGVKLY